jgi:alpha-D-ribose 1-methylphosphonate 5-triphosphate synthase subunit PhnH
VRWDPVHDGRRAFLACFRALCEPGAAITGVPRAFLHSDVKLDVAAAILLALLDPGIGLCLTGGTDVSTLSDDLCRLSGAVPVSPERASYLLVTDRAATSVTRRTSRGSALEPERGATIIYAGSWEPVNITIERGAGDRRRRVAVGLPPEELDALAAANAEPPLGVDALVVNGHSLLGLPRSAVMIREAS